MLSSFYSPKWKVNQEDFGGYTRVYVTGPYQYFDVPFDVTVKEPPLLKILFDFCYRNKVFLANADAEEFIESKKK